MKELNETNLLDDFTYKNEYIKKILNKLLDLLKKDLGNTSYLNWLQIINLSNQGQNQKINTLHLIFNDIGENSVYKAVFAIHTVMSLIAKLLTYSLFSNLNNRPIKKITNASSLKKFLNDIESGIIYNEFGIANMCQYDVFSWYLEAKFDDELYDLLIILKDKATQYSISSSIDKDVIKPLYENLVPKEVRYSLGEHYTPQNVADFILSKSKEFLKDKASYKAIDPTCGSGTFLLSVIKDKIKSNRIEQVLNEVVGVDINPIAVITAKFNYIFAIYPLMLKNGIKPNNITIPIYLEDATFMSDYIGNFDLIIGNPPWVRWSVLPDGYKSKIKNSLRNESIFSRDTNYGGIDLNLSALIAYRMIKNSVNKDGVLSFIFPYGVLKNKSYEGFRNLNFGDKTMEIKMVLEPYKPFFDGEEPVVLILQHCGYI
jgi:type I restriction-modification system DNA methylase subunit